MNARLGALVCLTLLLGSTSTALAQTPAASGPGIGLRGLATIGVSQMTAADSFEPIFGSSSMSDVGAGAQVTNLWRGLFAEVLFARSKETGERVFTNGGEVFPLGIPLTLTLNTVDVAAGYRFNRRGRLVPYVGAGLTSVGYRETSPFALPGDDVDERFSGLATFAGVELRALRWLHVRGDVRYRRVPNALGDGGVSAVFGDDNLGGLRFGASLVVGR
jgi:opacity protein-like surface antigen